MTADTLQSIPESFFSLKTLDLAKKLLGLCLVHETDHALLMGRVIETEAYLFDDPACHASRGETPRNTPMFGPPGRAYVYLIYGMYECFNVVSGPVGKGEAVLIRALQPLSGLERMKKNRIKKTSAILKDEELCNGPGKLTLALGIDRSHNRCCLRTSALRLMRDPAFGKSTEEKSITTTTRIGIRQGADLPYRFYLENFARHARILQGFP